MEETFSPQKTYSLWFRGQSIKLFIEGLTKYLEYLQPDVKPGNVKLTEEFQQNKSIIKWLEEQHKKCTSDWDMTTLSIPGEILTTMKSTLQYLLNDTNIEREEILKKNRPKDATEELDQRIALIEELMTTGLMSVIPTEEIMGKITKKIKGNMSEADILDGDMLNASKQLNNKPDNNDRAVDHACTTLEDRIRQSSGLPNNYYGDGLVDKAFRFGDGIIIFSDDKEEQDGYHLLYKGFLKALKILSVIEG